MFTEWCPVPKRLLIVPDPRHVEMAFKRGGWSDFTVEARRIHLNKVSCQLERDGKRFWCMRWYGWEPETETVLMDREYEMAPVIDWMVK